MAQKLRRCDLHALGRQHRASHT